MDNVTDGMRVKITVAADDQFGGYCGTASAVNTSKKTAFIDVTHKPDCTKLPVPMPLKRFSWDDLEACHCQ